MRLKLLLSVSTLLVSYCISANQPALVKIKKGDIVSLQNGQLVCANAEHLGEYYSRLVEGLNNGRGNQLAEQLILNQNNPDLSQASCLHVPSEIKFAVASIYVPKMDKKDRFLAEHTTIVGIRQLSDNPGRAVLYTVRDSIEKKYR